MNAPETSPDDRKDETAKGPLPFIEFVALIAGAMALTALSIDLMLPALPDISGALRIRDPNDRQWIITLFMVGISIGSLVHGPLSDRFGRKPVLATSIGLFLVACLVSTFAPSFEVMLASRFCAGLFLASNRVVSVSIVRDGFHGDAMARVMSLIFLVFMIVPVVAPTIGQLVLLVAPWRWVFGLLTFLGSVMLLWIVIRLPETLRPENRVETRISDLRTMFLRVVGHRSAIGHTAAAGVIMASINAFIVSVQQIMFDTFDAGRSFALLFSGIAVWMVLGSYLNSRFVRRFGARRMNQGALLLFLLITGTHSLIIWCGRETLPSFMLLQGFSMFCLPFMGSNMNAIAMEPFARGAGLASSVQTFVTTMLSALLGAWVGARFDGTTLPLALGFFGFGLLTLLIILWAERGRMFARPALLHEG